MANLKNNKDWCNTKLARWDVFNKKSVEKPTDETVKLKNVYSEDDKYVEFEPRELNDDDRLFLQVKLISDTERIRKNLQEISNNVKTITTIIVICFIISIIAVCINLYPLFIAAS